MRRALHGFDPTRLVELRSDQGLSRSDLGRLAGVSYNSLLRWETGAAVPSPDLLARIATTLGVDVAALAAVREENRTLASWRTQSNLTQGDVATALGISCSTYSRLERGERPPTAADTNSLARLFDITTEQVRTSWERAHKRPAARRKPR